MLLDPTRGEVLDFVGGRADLDAGIIRAIGDPERRFAEDKLRMLRAVRFAARFGFEIEAETFAAICRQAKEIQVISRERVRDELTRMLVEGHARRAFQLLDQSGLLKEVLPEISALKGVQQPAEFHPEGDVFVHTLLLLDHLPQPCPPTLAWGALLHDVGKPATFRVAPDRIRFDGHVEVGVKIAEEVCSRLRFSKHDAAQVLALIDNHMRFGHVFRMKESTLKRFLRLPHFDENMALHRADSLASHGQLRTYEFLQLKLKETPPEIIRPRALISGDDLIAAGHSPGPRFRQILSAVEDAQLEGQVSSREAALGFIATRYPSTGGAKSAGENEMLESKAFAPSDTEPLHEE
jgi:poly(A) polymerase